MIAVRQIANRVLGDPILEGMEGDDAETTARRQEICRIAKRVLQDGNLLIHRDPQGLKCPGSTMNPSMAVCGRHGVAYRGGKVRGRAQRAIGSCANDGTSDSPGVPLLAISINHVGQLPFRQLIDKLSGCPAGPSVHSHVQRPLEAEAEPPRRIGQLHRRHTQVEEHAINETGMDGRHMVLHIAKGPMDQSHTRPKPLEALATHRDRGLILIEADEQSIRLRRFQDSFCVTALPDGAVHVHSTRSDSEAFHNLTDQNGNVDRIASAFLISITTHFLPLFGRSIQAQMTLSTKNFDY